jgi:hypothetical protein
MEFPPSTKLHFLSSLLYLTPLYQIASITIRKFFFPTVCIILVRYVQTGHLLPRKRYITKVVFCAHGNVRFGSIIILCGGTNNLILSWISPKQPWVIY